MSALRWKRSFGNLAKAQLGIKRADGANIAYEFCVRI